MQLTPSQTAILQTTTPLLTTHGPHIAKSFYESLLSTHPGLRNAFNTTHQTTQHQPRALAASLLAFATHANDLDALTPVLRGICAKHVSLDIKPELYDVVGAGLLAALSDALGEQWTDEVAGAWRAGYEVLAGRMVAMEEAMRVDVRARGWVGWRECVVVRMEMLAEDIVGIDLVPREKSIPEYSPGMYVSVRVAVPEMGEGCLQSRQYSLCCAPGAGVLRIGVKREDEDGVRGWRAGFVSNALHGMGMGSVIEISCPIGEFCSEGEVGEDKADAAPLVLLGAGVGITPLMAMLEAEKEKRPVTIVHTARRKASRAFHDRIRELEEEHSRIKAVFFATQPDENEAQGAEFDFKGRMNLEMVKEREGRLYLEDRRTQYFICGPAEFMHSAEDKLQKLGVGKERIHTETFGVGGKP